MNESNIEKLVQEYYYLKEAEALLLDLFLEIGPYNDNIATEKTWNEVLKHFKFDDSE